MDDLSKVTKTAEREGYHTIFLAEDDEDDQELIRLAFTTLKLKHQLEIVNNGQEMLDALDGQSTLPCLIILDLNMPILNGIQTLKELKENPRFTKIPKVILTTSDSEENKSKCYSYGATGYFVKPSRMTEIVTTVEKIVSYCH
ncbi:response regulator [Chryseolinea sp. H1M3-3]|uniref:response regulator n=1 Tax=Chryseolinea sp. H1M3-3 TaxID=3034144 RepID=UPI0023ED508A|nr:response regulator [Chryseolinea sp. H1M3-3]